MESLVSIIHKKTSTFLGSIPKKERKQYGQFFTSWKIAEHMASMFAIDPDKPSLKILDAGAGTGILAAALAERLRNCGFSGEISIVCYENDTKVTPVLIENMEFIKERLKVRYEIRIENYLTSQTFMKADLYKRETEQYDMIIGNPPYLKISKDAPEAKAMSEICHGAPNLYFLFWSMGINNLKAGEQMVYIIPRSWTSGVYFERFRKYLFKHCVITDIHIFQSRDKVFDGESVLQETMIVKVKKSRTKPQYVTVSSSGTSDFDNIQYYNVDYNVIVAPNMFVFLVTNTKELEILSRVNSLNYTLNSDDLKMRTGIIVDFRSRDVLRNNGEDGSYPLFYAHHIRNGRVSWPIGRDAEYIMTDRIGYLQENTNYLFVKRFTSKEEKRRLQCGIYLKTDQSRYKYISTQNKINYIKCDTPELAYGLYVLLNSTLYDSYYRILNGSTQVNATEINLMPVPAKDVIKQMGRELIGQELTELNCDRILDKWIR